MANLTETATWEAGIYQLETDDPVLGGPSGISNQQGKQLANRTLYLKNAIETAAIITDFDIAIVGGTYYAAADAANAPNDTEPFIVYIGRRGDVVSQLVVESNGGTVYYRTSNDAGANWQVWKSLTNSDALSSVYTAINNVFVPTTFTGNLNTVTTADTYFVTKTGSSNLPPDLTGYTLDNFFLEVRKSGTYVVQIATSRLAGNNSSQYIRTSTDNGSTWGAWMMQAGTEMLQHNVDRHAFQITVGTSPYVNLNFNSIILGGQYTINTSTFFANVTNQPPGLTANNQDAILEVFSTAGGTAKVLQRVTTLHNNVVYTRTNNAGTWSAWKTITAT